MDLEFIQPEQCPKGDGKIDAKNPFVVLKITCLTPFLPRVSKRVMTSAKAECLR